MNYWLLLICIDLSTTIFNSLWNDLWSSCIFFGQKNWFLDDFIWYLVFSFRVGFRGRGWLTSFDFWSIVFYILWWLGLWRPGLLFWDFFTTTFLISLLLTGKSLNSGLFCLLGWLFKAVLTSDCNLGLLLITRIWLLY